MFFFFPEIFRRLRYATQKRRREGNTLTSSLCSLCHTLGASMGTAHTSGGRGGWPCAGAIVCAISLVLLLAHGGLASPLSDGAHPSRPSLFEEEGGGRANPGGAPGTRQLLNFPYTNPFGGGQAIGFNGQLSNAKEFESAYPWKGYNQSSTWDGNWTVLPVMSPGGAVWGQNYSSNSSFPWFGQNGTNGSMWIGVTVQTPTWIRGTAMVESDAEDQTSTVMMKAANCTNVAALFYCPFAIDGAGRISRTPQAGFGYPPCGDPGCAYISLARLNITSVDRDTFKDMALLEILDLGHNALTSVDDGAFRGTPRLKRLNLKGHSLPVIRNGMFSGRLSNLVLLDLSYCQVPYSPSPSGGMLIEPGAFLDLTGLEVLNLYASQLTDESLATGIFRRCSRLSRLDLSYNRLTIVNDAILAGLSKSLVSLGLDGNKIACISKGAFAVFTRLVQVGLAKNSLTVLPSKVFDDVGKAVHPSSGGGKPRNEDYLSSIWEYDISPDDWDPQFEFAPYMPDSFRSNSSISEGYFDPFLDTKEISIEHNNYAYYAGWYNRNFDGIVRCCDGSTVYYYAPGTWRCYGPGAPSTYIHNADGRLWNTVFYSDGSYEYNGWCLRDDYSGRATPGTFSGRQIPQYHYDTDQSFTSADGKDIQYTRQTDKGHPSFSWGVINLAGNSLECRLAKHSWLQINAGSDRSFDPYTLPPCPEEVAGLSSCPDAGYDVSAWPPRWLKESQERFERYPTCQETRTWSTILQEIRGGSQNFKTGGLGKLRVKGEMEIWLCVYGHPCLQAMGARGNDWMCYAFDKGGNKFRPWGIDSELKLCSSR